MKMALCITGNRVPATSIWACEAGHEEPLYRGDWFPDCSGCGRQVSWKPVRDIPGKRRTLD